MCHKPSMEPRLFSRGNPHGEASIAAAISPLQWSHDYLVVETELGTDCFVITNTLQWSHDYLVVETEYQRQNPTNQGIPSMEPRLFSRGNTRGNKL